MYYTQYNFSVVGGKRDTILVATSPDLQPGSWTHQGNIGLPIAFLKLFTHRQSYPRSSKQSVLDIRKLCLGTFGMCMKSATNPIRVGAGDPEIEGEFQYKNGDYFYIFYAKRNCCPASNTPEEDVYHVEVCRSASVTCPYLSKDGLRCDTVEGGGGTQVIAGNTDRVVSSPSRVGVFNDVGGEGLVFQYQYLNASISYDYHSLQWGFNKLEF
ncbi:hypothetical protein BDZ45DRAFT_740579 [Acephala macrosclerotiorum]|nr:hypothetical protein BDZ45DRAFT_740579 [Acephala macrosclerotiorum]